jgi:hypothetical protein
VIITENDRTRTDWFLLAVCCLFISFGIHPTWFDPLMHEVFLFSAVKGSAAVF